MFMILWLVSKWAHDSFGPKTFEQGMLIEYPDGCHPIHKEEEGSFGEFYFI